MSHTMSALFNLIIVMVSSLFWKHIFVLSEMNPDMKNVANLLIMLCMFVLFGVLTLLDINRNVCKK